MSSGWKSLSIGQFIESQEMIRFQLRIEDQENNDNIPRVTVQRQSHIHLVCLFHMTRESEYRYTINSACNAVLLLQDTI
jgi:hypothetical protein